MRFLSIELNCFRQRVTPIQIEKALTPSRIDSKEAKHDAKAKTTNRLAKAIWRHLGLYGASAQGREPV
jgi:hypothetical protein